MKVIVKFRKDVLCIIIGEGKLRYTLQRQINNNGLSKFIKLVGRKPHSEIPIWINACDLFVLPSLNEGNPTVMFECLGCSKPFVGTRVGGVPEVITSEDYGLLVDPGNVQDLAEKIKVALNKNWDRKKITNYAEQYQWENISEQIRHIYCRVL
jgi:glycosyltransferase involved in cell wall biosynthesis